MMDQSKTIEGLQSQLEQLRSESQRTTKVQDVLYRIAEAASASEDLAHFYAALHALVGELMYAGNFFIALLDEQTGMLFWPYHVDEKDVAAEVWKPQRFQDDKGATSYVIRTGCSLHGATQYQNLMESGEIQIIGTVSQDAIFVPLKTGSGVLGTLAVQSYTEGIIYTEDDVQVLTFVASHIATALTRARAIEETRRRNAELAIINSVGEAMARTLDVKTMTRIVGDKVLEIFGCDIVAIWLLDPQTNLIHSAYAYDKEAGGYVDYLEPFPLGKGLTSLIITDRKGLRLGTHAAQLALSAYQPPEYAEHGEERFAESWLGVPIIVGDSVLGVAVIANYTAHSFDEGHERLLRTLSTNMGVAIENARRFEAEQQRAAELAIINSIQQALASKLDIAGIYEAVGERISQIFPRVDVGLRVYEAATDRLHFPYIIERGQRIHIDPVPMAPGITRHVFDTREPLLINSDMETAMQRLGSATIPGTQTEKSGVWVPILVGGEPRGLVELLDLDRENAFTESDVRLLTTIAGAMSVALENARLFDETQRLLKETEQRAAELAIINSVQHGLASKMEMQAIYDLVGNKIHETFPDAQEAGIITYDRDADLFHPRFAVERGKRLEIPAWTPIGFRKHVLATRGTMVINRDAERLAEEFHNPVVAGERAKSFLFVPLLSGGEVTGIVELQHMDREDAFTESDVRLLETLASSMSVALENARLFDETQRLLKETDQRAAELAIINSVQEGLASKLDMQGIYELVGDKIREIFNAQAVTIGTYDRTQGLYFQHYVWEKGIRYEAAAIPIAGMGRYLMRTRQPLVVERDWAGRMKELGIETNIVPGTEWPKSGVFVPLVWEGEVRGAVSLQNVDQEDAFDAADVRLLQTLASALSTALENARLFDETQRLLKETEQRAAELQIINSVQEGLASKLEMQGIYDLVGDKIRETFGADTAYIAIFDPKKREFRIPYYVDEGRHLQPRAIPLGQGLTSEVYDSRRPLLLETGEERKESSLHTAYADASKDLNQSYLGVPILVGQAVTGVLSVQSHKKSAFGDAQAQLLSTLANSMGVALENARLFDETQRLLKETEQRAAELEIINGVQEGLASKLDFQGIIDLVGDKVRSIIASDDFSIRLYDEATNTLSYPYTLDGGQRETIAPRPLTTGFTAHLIRTRQPLLINRDLEQRMAEFGSSWVGSVGAGYQRSFLGMPILAANRCLGAVALGSKVEDAFSDADVRLLQTITNSLGVALENARLFDETQRLLKETDQRAAELAIINSVQEALASKLDIQAIYDLVGERIRAVFDAQAILIESFDHEKQNRKTMYAFEEGRRVYDDTPQLFNALAKNLIASREPVVINEAAVESGAKYGLTIIPGTAAVKSMIFVPFGTAGQVNGYFSLQNLDREHAFSESDVSLLQTLAGSMGIALENARLFEAERKRAIELSAISTVSQALVAAPDLDRMIQLIGDQLRSIFNPDIAYVALLNRPTNMLEFRYQHGDEMAPMPYGQGLTSKMLETGRPLLINRDIAKRRQELGTERVGKQAASYLGVPIMAAGEAIGAISVQSTEVENAFTEDDSRLLSTIAANAGAAIQTARLHTETHRRAQEMATLAEIGSEIAATRDLDPVLRRIAEHALSIMRVRDIAISLREEEGDKLRTRVALGRYSEQMKDLIIEPGRGILGDIVQRGQAEIVNNPDSDPRKVTIPGTPDIEEDPECMMAAPLVSQGETIGSLTVWRLRREGQFSQVELDFLVSVARQTTIAIESARLYLETQRRANEMSALAEVGREISASLDSTEILGRIAERAQELLGAESSAVYLMEPDRKGMRAIVALGQSAEVIKADRIRLGEGIIGTLAQQAGAEVVNDAAFDPRAVSLPGMKEEEADSERMMAAPLMRGEDVIGMLVVWRTTAPFSQADLNFLIGLARQAAIALENARLFDEVKRQGAYLETIFLNSPVAIVTVDEQDRVLSWSPAAEKLFGYASAEAVGRNVDDLVANSDEIRQEAATYTKQGKQHQYVHRVTRRTRKDGTLIDVDLAALPLPLQGGKTGVVAIYNDVGEIQRQRKYYEAIVQNSPVAIVTVDQDSKVASWNPGAEQLFGYTREEAIGRNIDDLVAGTGDIHAEAEAYNQQARQRELHVITRRTRKDATLVDVELSGVPLPLPTGESGLVAIYHDITELQRARQEAVAANEAKSAFLATMSHEIRTPMNAVIGMSGLLMDTDLSREQRDYAETIRNSGDALLTIINDILDFSKIEAGKMELENQPFDLRECVESAVDLVAGRANEKGLDLAYIIEDDVPAGIRGDVTRLRQILLNLVSNAVKFTDKGEVVLTVRPGTQLEQLLFIVRDSGIGIARNRMGRLFTSFSQADSSTTRRFGGTGLGLAISRRLAEMMGGIMWADSAGQGKGSTFSFTIQAPAVKVTPRRTVRELNGIQPALSGKRVLIVDDNETNRRILMLQTAKWGMAPRETDSPREALRLLKSGAAFDLAIFDVQMPELDGVTLAREVRKLKNRRALPVILLTSLGRKEAGADDLEIAAFLTKPLKPSSLFDALAGIFGGHAAAPRGRATKAGIDSGLAAENPLRILLAEDNAVNQKLALRLLEQMGYRADVASNGIEAVESVQRQAYDVVLMDVQMPEMDGLDATRAIRKIGGLAQPHIIAMTANAMQGDREMCLAAGMDDYVSKPIRVAELIEALRRARGSSRKPPGARTAGRRKSGRAKAGAKARVVATKARARVNARKTIRKR